MQANPFPWYALWVRSRHEKIVAASLIAKGYDPFLPVYESGKRSAGSEPSRLPLFPGYVFCRFDVDRSFEVVTTPGFVSVVSAGIVPLPVDEEEIRTLQLVAAEGHRVIPRTHLHEGERVRVEYGPLRGVEGIFLRERTSCSIYIAITMLQRGVSVEVPLESVVPVTTDVRFKPRVHPRISVSRFPGALAII